MSHLMYPYSGTATTWTGPAAALHASPLELFSKMWKQSQGDTAGHPARLASTRCAPNLLAILQGRPETKLSKHFSDVTSVVPNTFAKPQPRPDLSHILNWQDQTERCSPQSNTNSPYKGIMANISLVTSRRHRENEASNAAPAWPPAPELIANPPNWGPEASAQPPTVPSLGLNIGLPIASTVSAGYFIGRDGTEWPLPPSECMPKTRPSQSPIAPPSRALPRLSLDGDRWTTPIVALNGAHPDGDTPCGDEVYGKQGMLSCSTAASALPRTPADDDVLLPVRKASRKANQVTVKPPCGVIGEGRPKPQTVCPPTPFMGTSLRLPSPPFLASQGAYAESELGPESEGGYWISSGSEYSDLDSDESDVWSGSDVHSASDSDSDEEGDSEPGFFSTGAP